MNETRSIVLIVGIALGIIIGIIMAPLIPGHDTSWKLIPIQAAETQKYSNIYYPAYLLNQDTGQVIVIGDASYDKDKDGVTDKWEIYNKVLFPGKK